MDHRLFAVFAIICFALEGAGCASKTQRAHREEILLPLQTGSTLQRRVVITTDPVVVTKKSTKKQESKANPPKPTPAPEVTEEETPAAPDRFR
jgi:cell division septation protein DedD